jgi:cysteine desulfurase
VVTRIYLDFAATTPARPEAVEAMQPFFSEFGANPSSLHTEGRAAKAALDAARDCVARLLGARANEVVFTSGGSEADTLALAGTARALRSSGRRHIVSTEIEHHAVLHTLDALREDGWEITLLPVDKTGAVDPAAFEAALRPDTALASIMYANNEIGTVAPIAELAAIAHRHGVLFHTDAVQAPAYLPLHVQALGIDMLSLAAHKFGGPKGAGALFVRAGTPLAALLPGGGQEFGKRAGTENVAAISGLACALDLAVRERAETGARVSALRDWFEEEVMRRIPDVRVNGAGRRIAHITNLSILGLETEPLLLRLDLDGVAVSSGSACASGALEPSHVIAALRLETRWMQGVLRFSFGRTTTKAEVHRAVEVLEAAVAHQRSSTPAFQTKRIGE